MELIKRYTAEEVLVKLHANYLHEQQLDPEVEGYQEFTFETTVRTWRDICDLPEPYKLAGYFNQLFGLNTSVEKWILILQPERIINLRVVCEYIATHAVKIDA
ncbi:MAG: hypothetical protein ABJA85_01965 [Bacteroidota bacterium]